MKKVTIIGLGLVGTLLAIYLARRSYSVTVYDARPHPTLKDEIQSQPLFLSHRGITSLNSAGLGDVLKKYLIPLCGQVIHDEHGKITYLPFGRSEEEYIHIIAYSDLINLLLKTAASYPNVQLYFASKLTGINLHKKELLLERSGQSYLADYEILIGADGASSKVSSALEKMGLITVSHDSLNQCFKTLSIRSGETEQKFHLWPRADRLLFGSPTPGENLMGSIVLPKEGSQGFSALNNERLVRSFFQSFFPDVYKTMPSIVEEFMTHSLKNISMVNCSNWFYEDQCMLIGDAAHGIIPFFSEGINCGFEDCYVLNRLLNLYRDEWWQAMPAFFKARKANTDAVAEISLEKLRDLQRGDQLFQLKNDLEQALMARYPDQYVSKQVLILFTNTVYSVAKRIGEFQDGLLNSILAEYGTIEAIDWKEIDKRMRDYDKSLAILI